MRDDKPPHDEPLDPRPDSTPFSDVVIDLAEVRVRFGLPRNFARTCEHRSLIYNTQERRVWCEDCERTIENFDAFKMLTAHFQAMLREALHAQRKATEALAAVIVRRAAKALDRMWGRKMAACCPHCRKGLLPEDFENGASFAVSRDIEIARRKKEAPSFSGGAR